VWVSENDCCKSFDALPAAAASGAAPPGWARVHKSSWKSGSKLDHECSLDEPVAMAAGHARGFYYFADNSSGCCFEDTPSSRRNAKINAADANLTIHTVSFLIISMHILFFYSFQFFFIFSPFLFLLFC
jgi:hypothetical protein